MGYYGWDQPDSIDVTVSFECNECQHQNDEIELSVSEGTDFVDVQCEKCKATNLVDLPTYEDYCHCGDHCRC